MLAGPILGILESAAVVESADLLEEAETLLCADENEPFIPCLMQMLRSAEKAPAMRASNALDSIRRHCVNRLEARIALPARTEDDWSITPPKGCSCRLCDTLDAFLTDSSKERLEWPLAKEGRRHVHGRIDAYELPVRHQTRRSGRPYTLVLSKTKELFEQHARERRSWQTDLDWLTKKAGTGHPQRTRRATQRTNA